MPDTIADLILSFSHLNVILLIVLSGFLLINKSLFFQTACLTTFDIVVNVALKGSFQIPLALWLGNGYAFPSGHMQMATVFYLWLALHTSRWTLRLVIILLLAAIGSALIHYSYHNLHDVLGGFIFGCILISFYWFASNSISRYLPWVLIAFASLLMIYNGTRYNTIPSHTWVAYYTLLGLITVERILLRRGNKQCWQPVQL